MLGAVSSPASAQQQDPPPEFQSDALEQVILNGQKVRKLTGNVIVRQPGQTLYAQEAYQYETPARTVFIGGVRIDQGEGRLITGDSLILPANSKIAKIRGNVVYVDGPRTLRTPTLDYDGTTGLAIYNQGGEINDNGTILKSQRGRYNKATGLMYFYGGVTMQGAEYNLVTDSLHYNTATHLADFFGPTTIVNKDGTVNATRGTYNTETGTGLFKGRSSIDSEEYRLFGNVLDFNRNTGNGVARGNVLLFSKKDSIAITADLGFYNKRQSKARLYGNTLIKAPNEGADTLYIRSDSINAITDTVSGNRIFLAKSRVRIYQKDFQAICDSLAYASADSTIRFYRNPFLWAAKNQSSADTIYARLRQRKIDSLILIRNSFLVSVDTLGHFNQVKGRFIKAAFNGNKIQRAFVRGNGQSLYHAVDETKLTYSGMNKMVCSNMVIRFDSAGRLSTISALVKPEARFIPPQEIAEPEKKLKGFNWKPESRPTRASVLNLYPPEPKTRLKKQPKTRANKSALPTKIKKGGKAFKKTTSPKSGPINPTKTKTIK
jgi:lipopolysaccharide export system protein LptA